MVLLKIKFLMAILFCFSELWREETTLTTAVQNCKDEIAHIEMGLRSMSGRVILTKYRDLNDLFSVSFSGHYCWNGQRSQSFGLI